MIHKESSWDYDHSRRVNARVVPRFIETNITAVNYFLMHPDEFKVLMAHEIGHITNDDFTPENMISGRIYPASQKTEISADRLGAIMHGNPKEYAKASIALLSAMTSGDLPHIYTSKYLSTNGRLRMLHKWADILEREKAIDEKGRGCTR